MMRAVLGILALGQVAFAHPGRTDEKGGHRDSKTGEYHYHRPNEKAAGVDGGRALPDALADSSGKALPKGPPLGRGSIVLRVEAEQIVRGQTNWQTSWGDFSKDLINQRILVIDLKKLGNGDPRVEVHWYFVGRDHDQDKLFIYDSGNTSGSITPGGSKVVPSSALLTRNRASYRNGRLTGQSPWGWAVFVSQNGKAIAETASVPELVQWTQEKRKDATKNSSRAVPFVPQGQGVRP